MSMKVYFNHRSTPEDKKSNSFRPKFRIALRYLVLDWETRAHNKTGASTKGDTPALYNLSHVFMQKEYLDPYLLFFVVFFAAFFLVVFFAASSVLIAACAAERRAIGTRYGEQLT